MRDIWNKKHFHWKGDADHIMICNYDGKEFSPSGWPRHLKWHYDYPETMNGSNKKNPPIKHVVMDEIFSRMQKNLERLITTEVGAYFRHTNKDHESFKDQLKGIWAKLNALEKTINFKKRVYGGDK